MNNLVYSLYDEESSMRPQAKRGLIIKHDGNNNKSGSRPGSSKKVRIPEVLEKKVENLEKKHEMWKEREQVWGKERKNLERALKNACKDPNEYYKNLLNNWHMARTKIKPNPDVFYEKLEKLRGFLTWVLDQSGETPLKYIKQLTKEQFEYLDEIENRHKLSQDQQNQEYKKIIESLQKENNLLEEQMASGMQDLVNSLQSQIKELSNELFASRQSLEKEQAKKKDLSTELEKLEEKLKIKDSEMIEYTMNIRVLEEQIEVLKDSIESKKIINNLPIQEIAEGSQQVIESLVIKLKDLEEVNTRLKSMNEIYEIEVKNLQKEKILKKKPRLRTLDCFDVKIACTQTGIDENLGENDWMHIVNCMAVGLEAVLVRG